MDLRCEQSPSTAVTGLLRDFNVWNSWKTTQNNNNNINTFTIRVKVSSTKKKALPFVILNMTLSLLHAGWKDKLLFFFCIFLIFLSFFLTVFSFVIINKQYSWVNKCICKPAVNTGHRLFDQNEATVKCNKGTQSSSRNVLHIRCSSNNNRNTKTKWSLSSEMEKRRQIQKK